MSSVLTKNFFIIKNADYKNANGMECSLIHNEWPSLATATLTVTTSWGLSKAGTVVDGTSTNKTIYFELTRTETANILSGKYPYKMKATISSNDFVLAQGYIELKDYL